MDMQVQIRNDHQMAVDNWLEQVLFYIGDIFEIRIVWNRETAVFTTVMAVAGGIVGGLAGGRVGAALGAGIGSATGLGVSTVLTLREAWARVKEKLREVLYIILNYLRQLDPIDYVRAFEVLMNCAHSRRELVLTILDFIFDKLGREVLSNINRHAIE
ncbi:unnamed protein product [Arctia plantaginis]|uniref:Uncharacterized protein n=1 Tax=Arctia plantaginis TaxID=874455 RepID=A0A8S0YWT7_ARCPL|nr:unnamed protein product [Arctia plantaginis]CAB3233037.1 unnamed protein product [Arctia plantaginis]